MRAYLFLAILTGLLVLTTAASAAAKLGETCDGIAALKCEEGLCEHPAGECKMPDGAGTCVKETMEACADDHAPVCACPVGDKNPVEYPNDCERKKVKAQLDYVGACKK
jgi:hypothetical protein